jgi:hypothetical protein
MPDKHNITLACTGAGGTIVHQILLKLLSSDDRVEPRVQNRGRSCLAGTQQWMEKITDMVAGAAKRRGSNDR